VKIIPPLLVAAAGLLFAAGCDHLALGQVEGDPNRTITGTVHVRGEAVLPPGAQVAVRVVDASNPGLPPRILGEQDLANPGPGPVEFRVEYKATNAQLEHGLNVEARISFGGALRFYTLNKVAVTTDSARDPQVIWVDPATR
jgi:uncharacterized lipoprotein YbaY